MKRDGGEEWSTTVTSKKVDCDITGNITKTIELVNDSLASLSEEEVKQTRAKSPLVRYNVDIIPPYDGSIGKTTVIPYSKTSIPPFISEDSPSSISLPKSKPAADPSSRLNIDYELIEAYLDSPIQNQWSHYKPRNLAHMKELEGRSCVSSSHIKLTHRRKLFDWLAEVSCEFHLTTETTILSFMIADKYLEKKEVSLRQLQCLGATVLMLASKLTYDSCPSSILLSDLSLRTFSSKEVGLLENEVLSCLEYDILFVTSFDFILFDLVSIQADSKLTFLSLYLLECSVIEGSFLTSSPSRLAQLCVLAALRFLVSEEQWENSQVWSVFSIDKETYMEELNLIPLLPGRLVENNLNVGEGEGVHK
ncbi:hypothetical protein WA171_001189 [Blastocystis sp. BT1]